MESTTTEGVCLKMWNDPHDSFANGEIDEEGVRRLQGLKSSGRRP